MDFWLKQSEKPLFGELEWNKPERRDQAGRLLIVGGTIHSLSAPAKAYEICKKEGVGEVKIALPKSASRLVGRTLPDALFLPSTQSGELSSEAEDELLTASLWADSILLPGDNGRNSQTAILLEKLVFGINNQIIITRDAFDSLGTSFNHLANRENTSFVISFAQTQRLIKASGMTRALTSTLNLAQIVEILREYSSKNSTSLITCWQNQLIATAGGIASSTKLALDVSAEPTHWRLNVACLAVCYYTWNPFKAFESLTQAAYLFNKSVSESV